MPIHHVKGYMSEKGGVKTQYPQDTLYAEFFFLFQSKITIPLKSGQKWFCSMGEQVPGQCFQIKT